MSKALKSFLIITIFITLTLLSTACTTQKSKVGLLSMNKVLNESQRASELQEELVNISDELERDSQNEENSEKAYEKFSEKKKELEGKLNNEINDVLDKITTEEKIDIILYKNDSYYGGLDITSEVIKRLDEKHYSQSEGVSDEEQE